MFKKELMNIAHSFINNEINSDVPKFKCSFTIGKEIIPVENMLDMVDILDSMFGHTGAVILNEGMIDVTFYKKPYIIERKAQIDTIVNHLQEDIQVVSFTKEDLNGMDLSEFEDILYGILDYYILDTSDIYRPGNLEDDCEITIDIGWGFWTNESEEI